MKTINNIIVLVIVTLSLVFASRTEEPVPGNPVCSTEFHFKASLGIDLPLRRQPYDITLTLGSSGQITLYQVNIAGGTIGGWSSTIPISSVIVKGGKVGAYVYTYVPATMEDASQLHTTVASKTSFGAISHIDICWEPIVIETKVDISWSPPAVSVVTLFSWNMLITQPEQCLRFNEDWEGEADVSPFVTVIRSESNQSCAISGQFTVSNPDTVNPAVIDHITVTLGANSMDFSCSGILFPYTLSNGEPIQCTYSKSFDICPQGSVSIVVATTGTSLVDGNAAVISQDNFVWSQEKVHECVKMGLDLASAVEICSPAPPEMIARKAPLDLLALETIVNYTVNIFITDDEVISSWIQVKFCPSLQSLFNCTMTVGFWENYITSAGGEDAQFMNTNITWGEVFSQDDSICYWALAKQAVPAYLNVMLLVHEVSSELMSILYAAMQMIYAYSLNPTALECTPEVMMIQGNLTALNEGKIIRSCYSLLPPWE